MLGYESKHSRKASQSFGMVILILGAFVKSWFLFEGVRGAHEVRQKLPFQAKHNEDALID